MKTYCISDIHGRYDLFMELLEKIQLKNEDTLYILGDILDRGSNPIRVITKLMEMPNAICIAGNHEMMALECLKFLMQEVTDRNLEQLDEKMLDKLMTWQYNGADTTIDEFRKLNREMQQLVLEFLEEFLPYEKVTVKGNKYLLVHGGLGGFYQGKELHDYSIRELVWNRIDYDKEYYPDTYIITGHTPTQEIAGNPNPGYIYRKNNHIAIDYKLIETNHIPSNVTLMSDSGWECDATHMDGVYYNEEDNVIVFTQHIHSSDSYFKNKKWKALE